jgi:hypothetical protein
MKWLLLVFSAFLFLACAPSLQDAHVAGLAARRAAPPGTLGVAPSQRCTDLSDAHVALSGWAKAALGMVAASAAVVAIPAVRKSTAGWVTAVSVGGTFAAGAGGLQLASDGKVAQWAQEGCGAP